MASKIFMKIQMSLYQSEQNIVNIFKYCNCHCIDKNIFIISELVMNCETSNACICRGQKAKIFKLVQV